MNVHQCLFFVLRSDKKFKTLCGEFDITHVILFFNTISLIVLPCFRIEAKILAILGSFKRRKLFRDMHLNVNDHAKHFLVVESLSNHF